MRPEPRALCARHPEPELWFSFARSRDQKLAIVICQRCPVRDRCLSHAIDRPEVHGVWGGTTEVERREIVEAQGRAFVDPGVPVPLRELVR